MHGIWNVDIGEVSYPTMIKMEAYSDNEHEIMDWLHSDWFRNGERLIAIFIDGMRQTIMFKFIVGWIKTDGN